MGATIEDAGVGGTTSTVADEASEAVRPTHTEPVDAAEVPTTSSGSVARHGASAGLGLKRAVPELSVEALEAELVREGYFDNNFVGLREDAGDAFMFEVIELYISDSEEVMAAFEKVKANDEVDFDDVQYLAHRLKGSSLNVGMTEICHKCTEIRQLCLNKDAKGSKAAMESVLVHFRKAKARLLDWIHLHNMAQAKKLKS